MKNYAPPEKFPLNSFPDISPENKFPEHFPRKITLRKMQAERQKSEPMDRSMLLLRIYYTYARLYAIKSISWFIAIILSYI